jgi:hypothetical protein
MSKPRAKPKAIKEFELPRIDDHLPGEGRQWSGRTNITIWLDKDVIAACGPQPASGLRIWIETHHPATRAKYRGKHLLTKLQQFQDAETEEEHLNWVAVPPKQQKGKKWK